MMETIDISGFNYPELNELKGKIERGNRPRVFHCGVRRGNGDALGGDANGGSGARQLRPALEGDRTEGGAAIEPLLFDSLTPRTHRQSSRDEPSALCQHTLNLSDSVCR